MNPIPIAELEKRMRPGAYSEGGFLGPEESLAEVVCRDEQALQSAGISCEGVSKELERILKIVLDQRDKLLYSNYPEYEQREQPLVDFREFVDRELYPAIFQEYTERESFPASYREYITGLGKWPEFRWYHQPALKFSPDHLPELKYGFLAENRYQVFFIQYCDGTISMCSFP